MIWADSDLAHLTHPDPHLPPPEEGTPPPIEIVIRRMNEQVDEIHSALRNLQSADEPRTRFGEPSTVRELLAHLMQHEIYHAGQLRYLGYGMGIE